MTVESPNEPELRDTIRSVLGHFEALVRLHMRLARRETQQELVQVARIGLLGILGFGMSVAGLVLFGFALADWLEAIWPSLALGKFAAVGTFFLAGGGVIIYFVSCQLRDIEPFPKRTLRILKEHF